MKLNYLTDKQLHLDTKKLVVEERVLTAKLLHHLKEIDRRKLYSEFKYPSLFAYCSGELGMSEGAATRRVTSCRLLAELPELEEKIESGDLNLSNVCKAAIKFRQERITDPEQKREILKLIENKTTRECEKILAGAVGETIKDYYPIQLTAEAFKNYECIRGLLAHKRLTKDEMIELIFSEAVRLFTEVRFKKASTKVTTIISESRYIPAWMVNAVHERDKVCVKCGSSHKLEINHIIPFSMGGKTELSNLNLLCRNCNQRAAISSNLHFP